MQQGGGRSQHLGPLAEPTGPRIRDAIAIDVRFHLLGEVAIVLNDAANDQPSPARTGDSDRVSCPFVRVDSAEAHQPVTGSGWNGRTVKSMP